MSVFAGSIFDDRDDEERRFDFDDDFDDDEERRFDDEMVGLGEAPVEWRDGALFVWNLESRQDDLRIAEVFPDWMVKLMADEKSPPAAVFMDAGGEWVWAREGEMMGVELPDDPDEVQAIIEQLLAEHWGDADDTEEREAAFDPPMFEADVGQSEERLPVPVEWRGGALFVWDIVGPREDLRVAEVFGPQSMGLRAPEGLVRAMFRHPDGEWVWSKDGRLDGVELPDDRDEAMAIVEQLLAECWGEEG